ncbi:MAG: aminopeptidase [Planctomycetes bacterium]|nr:aminopeptidase [Planctomycetota bacterium]
MELSVSGQAPYKGYFDRDMAKREAERLKAEGYDVSLGGADGFRRSDSCPTQFFNRTFDLANRNLCS